MLVTSHAWLNSLRRFELLDSKGLGQARQSRVLKQALQRAS